MAYAILSFMKSSAVSLISTILLFVSMHGCLGIQEQPGSWYRGCYIQTADLLQKHNQFQTDLPTCAAECMKKGDFLHVMACAGSQTVACLRVAANLGSQVCGVILNRFYYTAMQRDTCLCLSRLENLDQVTSVTCDTKCQGLPDPNLACGGTRQNAWSVYTTSGPFIENIINNDMQQWIEPDIPVTLEAIAYLNEFVDISEEPLIESEWMNTVEFVWQSEFTVVGVNISANSSQERAVCTLTFPNTGNFPIELQVRNLLSAVEISFSVAVVLPKPRSIQMSQLNDPWSLPSCIPPMKHLENTEQNQMSHNQIRSIWNSNRDEVDSGVSPVVAVFANTTFALEVSVATGTDLLFDIIIWNGNAWIAFKHMPQEGEKECNMPIDCRSVVQEYVFGTTGIYAVSANVSNRHGSVAENLTVVVMDQHIRDVSVELMATGGNVVFTQQILVFHLTAITADRQSTFIRVDFGDGIVKTAAVREKQNVSRTDPTTPILFASYGMGCNLSLQFDHVYEKEGVFRPLVTLFNNVSSEMIKLKEPLSVLNEIQGVRIISEPYAPLNSFVAVSLNYAPKSANVTVHWIVSDNSDTVVINKTTSTLANKLNFAQTGRYKVACIVSNALSWKSAISYIIVQERIRSASLSCSAGPYIEVEQDVVCKAQVESGTDVKFEWDFQERTGPVETAFLNGSSVANYAFMHPGVYNITVIASNNVSKVKEQLVYSVHVEIPIECLNVVTNTLPVVGKAVNIVATATRGSSLKFDLQVGYGEMILPKEIEVNGDVTIFSEEWVFHETGRQRITALAYNHISNVSRIIEVHVQEMPPEFRISVLPTPFPIFRTVALKTREGEFLYRQDLLFHFHFAGGVTRTTQVPVVTWELYHSGSGRADGSAESGGFSIVDRHGQFRIDVTVSNEVGQKNKTLVWADKESGVETNKERRRNKKRRRRRRKPTLWHSTFVRADDVTSFLLANKSRGVNALHIDYGDGMRENVSCVSDSCSWGRKFQVPGVFALDVSLYGRRPTRKDHALRSVLVVEEPIKGLRLLGPTDVGIECDQDWHVKLDSGSHLVFVWSLDNDPESPTTNNKYVASFSKPGIHTLHVNVSNDIGSTQASLNFTVKHPIVDVSLGILPTILEFPTNINILIEGGRDFKIDCEFGDGQFGRFSSAFLTIKEIKRDTWVPSSYLHSPVPKLEVVLQHTYQEPGEYNVSVTVANGISSIHKSSRAVVEERIGSIVLYTENSELMSLQDELVVTAVVSSGRNLQFSWDFCDTYPSVVQSEGNTSKATHSFGIPALYEVIVTVSNHLQKEGIKATLPFKVDVIEPISNAAVTHISRQHLHTAALLVTKEGQMMTQDVEFEAKSDGSSVQFLFDFGDGHSRKVDGRLDLFYITTMASVKHVYTEEGVFTVRLTASNPLGNLTVSLQELFYVQIPPIGLKAEASASCIQFGEIVYFNASLEAGTNVSFSWKLDDETELINAGPNIEHQYRRRGKENIQVTAFNKVDAVSAYLSVQIVERILGVNLTVSDTIIVAGEPTKYIAMMHPPSALEGSWFEWKFYPYAHVHRQYKGNIEYTYRMSGRHNVQVKAVNCLGSVASVAIPLHVVAKLQGLAVTVKGDAIVSSPVQLMADYWQGDSLTFTWDFGDGSDVVTVNSSQLGGHLHRMISHSYAQIGEYMVRLWATNPVSRGEVSKRIFILDKPCDPPEITLLGTESYMKQNEVRFLHSESVCIESEVTVNCTTSSQVKFRWEIVDATNRRAVNIMVPWASDKKINRHLSCPTLLLPARTLARGKYLVRLQVEMNGTQIRVYADAEVQLTVLPTPLLSTIHGGIYRHAGQLSQVYLDGRGSGYPDDSSMELGYQWSCALLSGKGKYCFDSTAKTPLMNGSQLNFPSSWLTLNFSEFTFNLTVSKLRSNIEANETIAPAVSSQVIKLQPQDRTIDLLLECPQCWRNMVNSDKKVSLRTHCPTHPGEFLTYTWEVSLLAGKDSEFDFIDNVHAVCVNGDGSSYNLPRKLKNSPSAIEVTAESTSSPAEDQVRVPKAETSPILMTDLSAETDERKEYWVGSRGPVSSVGEGFYPEPAEDESQGLRRLGILDVIEEGMAGSSGSSAGRYNIGSVIEEPQEVPGGGRDLTSGGDDAVNPDTDREGRPGCTSKDQPDCLALNVPPSLSPPHLVSRDRLPILLTSDQTLTGLDQPSLVIKPGVLRQGRTYFVQVTATAKDGSTGLAMTYFEVNKSPRKGKCTVRPSKGVPQETMFSVFCTDWQDEHLPLRYEVSYSLDGSDSGEDSLIIYQGLRHKIKFQLPAGLAVYNYRVLLHIAVLDRLGAKTLICRIPIEVRPTDNHAGSRAAVVTDTLLWNEATSLLQRASHSIYDGVSHDLFGPLTQLASYLNTHGTKNPQRSPTPHIRALTRRRILKTLIYIPLRDEVELIQALRCLVETTNQANELTGETLLSARGLLQEINVEAKVLFQEGMVNGWSRGLNSQILLWAVKAVSNLLTALATNHDLFSNTDQQQRLYKSITSDGLKVINSLMQLEMQYHSLGEEPVLLKDKFLSLNASHYSLLNLSPLAMQGVLFQLPTSLAPLLSQNCDGGRCYSGEISLDSSPAIYSYKHNPQCFQARALSFPTNPFALISREIDMVQSELASLDIYNCFGDKEVNVQGLPTEDMIQIIMPRKGLHEMDVASKSYYLHKTAMNIHHLNGTSPHYDRNEDHVELSDKYLHVHIQLEPVMKGHTFPIMVIISSDAAPFHAKHHLFKNQYDGRIPEIKISLPPGSVDEYIGGQHYYIGLVEASFNSGRRRSDEIEGRHYSLSTWWGTCMYWNHTEDKWRSNGCEVMHTSSVEALHCRCSHLTTFGGYFELVPNDLSFTDVEEFFSLHENPLVVILVAVILLIYLLLAMKLRQTDIHDARKGNCVYLQDNTVSHHQKYEVVMETGLNRDAGTTSKISIILHGEEGMSETRELISDDNRPMFERNSRDRFIVTLPDCLGKIFKIQLWHNNSGSSPGWYLRQVVVRDLNAGQAFYFVCQKWLAVDKDDGKVEREFTTVDEKNISFGMIFWCKGSQYLSDFHTWVSMWTCPPHSRFTRVQRLTVCFTLLMTYMCLNAMWFKQTPAQIRGEFGLLDLSWHNIIVGFICCILVIPLNLMLSSLFRRSRVRYPGYEQDKVVVSGKPAGDVISEGEEEATQPAVTYSILDQSILNWQNIQDWAQKQWLKRQQSVRSSANSVKTTQTSPQLSAPSTTPLVQHTLLAEDDTDQGSSGFEDATSQATADRHRVKATSDISSDGKKSRNGNCNPCLSTVEHVHALNASRRIFLPFWCRYVAWILCFLISCACAAVTILYGFRFGHTKSVMWIQSVYFSFMVCLFIAQPFLILISIVYTAMSHRHNPAIFDHYDDGFYGERITTAGLHKQHSDFNEEEEELQRGVAERSRSRYLRFAGPPQEKHLKSSRKKLIRQKRAVLLLRDSIWFILMFTLLCIMAFGKNTKVPCEMNVSLKHAFVEKQMNNTSFLKLKSPTEWYNWSHSVLLDTLYTQTSLNGELGQMAGDLGYVIGQVQIRQLIRRSELCYGARLYKLDGNCFYDDVSARKPWLYKQTGSSLWNPGLWGQAAWYDDGGYVLSLNHSREDAEKQLEALEAENWIGRHTHAVFVELTLYNAAVNLFSSATLLLEVTPAGKVLTSAHIMSSYIFRYITPWDNFVLGCELLYIVLSLWMSFHEFKRLVKLGRSYFCHFWNFIEFLMALVSLCYVGSYIFRFILVSEAVEFMRSTFYEEFINLHNVTQWDELLKNMTSVLLFCVIVKVLKALRYHQVFWRLQTVYRRCRKEILMAAVLYGGLVMAFSSLSTSLFGSVVCSLRSLWSSMLTVSALSVRAADWLDEGNAVSSQSQWLDIVLLFSFTFCHGFVLTYIFIVLAYRLKKTKHCRVLAMPGSQLLAFYWDMILKWSGSRPEASYEQTDSTLPPEFTMAEILYLVEELLFRMNALLGTSSLPDKRHSFTDSDATPNEGDDGISSGGSEERPIPVTTTAAVEGARLEQRVQKIEDKLCCNEPYLAQLLKLDSIGTDILSEEKEKELRSHLEFEIFRQLQMQRQESAVFDTPNQPYVTCPAQDPRMPQNLPASKTSSPSVWNASDDLAAAHDGRNCRWLLHPAATRTKDDSLPSSKNSPESSSSGQESPQDSRAVQELQAAQPKPIILLPPKRSQSMKVPGKQAGRHHLNEAMKAQKQWLDLSTTYDSVKARPNSHKAGSTVQKYPKICGKKDFQFNPTGHEKKSRADTSIRHDVLSIKRPILGKEISPEMSGKTREPKSHSLGVSLAAPSQIASSGNVSPQSSESERGHKHTDSSSGQSGHERNDTPKIPSKRPELPPKPTFAHNMLQSLESGRAFAGWTPKPRQFTFVPDLMNPVGAESSSGSEQEATLSSKRAAQGRRNLRKTKSRGKGKGNEGGITSPMVLAADFASSGQSGGSDFDIIIHPVPSGIDPNDNTMPEEYLH